MSKDKEIDYWSCPCGTYRVTDADYQYIKIDPGCPNCCRSWNDFNPHLEPQETNPALSDLEKEYEHLSSITKFLI